MSTTTGARPTLAEHRAVLTPGRRFNYSTFFAPFTNSRGEHVVDRVRGSRFSTWQIQRIEERGAVVAHPGGGHEHLVEWISELSFFGLCA